MTLVIKKIVLMLIGLCCFSSLHASDFGVSLASAVVSDDLDHGYRAAITYQPKAFVWSHYSVYFDAGFSHWWIDKKCEGQSVNIFSVAPYFRYFLVRSTKVSPYIEASIGLSYIDKTQMGKRNQGIHFTFQDQLGIGLAYGAEQRFFTTFSALHYSNCRLSAHNSGITVPLLLTIGYRF